MTRDGAGSDYLRSVLLCMLTTFLASCSGDGHLRGQVSLSDDGKTYFAVLKDNGKHCHPIKLDGEVWGYGLGEVAEVPPGVHTIQACIEIEFDIPAGTVFEFDYWGP